MFKVAIIDDDPVAATILIAQLEDFFVEKNIPYRVQSLTSPAEIKEFVPDGEDMIILDMHLFDDFNHRSDKIENFPNGEELARYYKKIGFCGKCFVFTGDEEAANKSKKGAFFGLFSKKNENFDYAVRGSDDGFRKIAMAIEEIAK